MMSHAERYTAAVNVTQPAFAAERRRLLSIDISCRGRSAQRQTRRTLILRYVERRDRGTGQTDGYPTVT